ncbi:Tetratricopeptide-like helical domain superfamily [Sesbania bispinosa]|nr:Tetratricopeptide-like helical domain superfamily [Sesbania bispinosa]
MDQALKLFNAMPQRNVVSSNAVITGFLLNGDVDSAVSLFKTMPERDLASLSALISGLVRNGELDMAAGILLEYGNGDDLVQAYNTLIAGYGQRGKVEEARRLFDGIPSDQGDGNEGGRRFRRNVVSWNSMMMCYVKVGDIVSARELFDRMMERDTCSWNTMISGYVQISDMEEASKLFKEMPSPDALSWNSIISGFAQIGNLKLAKEFFERMPCKNLISWNTVIAGYEKNEDYKGATKLFSQMQLEGERPDRHTLSSVLSVCTGLVDLYLERLKSATDIRSCHRDAHIQLNRLNTVRRENDLDWKEIRLQISHYYIYDLWQHLFNNIRFHPNSEIHHDRLSLSTSITAPPLQPVDSSPSKPSSVASYMRMRAISSLACFNKLLTSSAIDVRSKVMQYYHFACSQL